VRGVTPTAILWAMDGYAKNGYVPDERTADQARATGAAATAESTRVAQISHAAAGPRVQLPPHLDAGALPVSQLQDVIDVVWGVLSPDAVGAYLHGSAVRGGLRPGSDVDVLVVTGRRTSPAQRRALVEGLMDISGARARRGPARPVELTVVVDSDLRPWWYPPRCELLYGEWLRSEFEQGAVPEPGPSPDLAVLVTMVHQGNAPLVGPPPGEVLDPVPPADLARAVVAGVPDLLADLEHDTRNVILTLLRIWTTIVTGEIQSKDAAADWALERLPEEHRAVVAHARAIYLGHVPESWDGELRSGVRPLVDHLVALIERLDLPAVKPL